MKRKRRSRVGRKCYQDETGCRDKIYISRCLYNHNQSTMERYQDQIFHKVVNLESRLSFVERYLHVDNSQKADKGYSQKPVKIIIENEKFTAILHPTEINCQPFVKYVDDPFFDVFFVRIYLHGSSAIHEENGDCTIRLL